MKQGKVWGETQEIFLTDSISAHVLTLKRGGFSSEHRHKKKSNVFAVISGRLEVRVWPEGSKVPDVTHLRAGERTVVPPRAWHQFRALEDSVVIEICELGAFVPTIQADIERRVVGGSRA